MKVYIVVGVIHYEGSDNLAVFFNDKAAHAFIVDYKAIKAHKNAHDDYCVEEHIVIDSKVEEK